MGSACRRSRFGARTSVAPTLPPRGAFAADVLGVFTLRVGDWRRLADERGRRHTENAMYAEDGQRTPHHDHVVKTEDVIDRGGATLKERFRAVKDVKTLDLGPGDRIALEPGESLTLEPFVAHAFWAEGGAVLAGEVSLVNDDASDNYFLPPLAAPAPIEEDRPKRYVTVRDHSRFVGLAA